MRSMKWIVLLSLAVLMGISLPGIERLYFLPVGALLALVAMYERRRYEKASAETARDLRAEV
jgi:hypothetical protein